MSRTRHPNLFPQPFPADVSSFLRVDFLSARSGSFSVETILRGDRSLMDDVPVKSGVISMGVKLARR
jgi:hypothetical protein